MKQCPICGTPFDPRISYDGTRFTGQPRKWCTKHCADVAHYQRMKAKGYFAKNHQKRLDQARARYHIYQEIRERRRARHQAQKTTKEPIEEVE